jgi:hypothetical protein
VTTTQARSITAAVLALLLFGAGVWIGATVEHTKTAKIEADWARERTQYAERDAASQRRALAAEREGAALAARLQEAEAAAAQRGEEKNREIAKLAVGRPCLSANLTRLLNQSAARSAAGVPTHSGGANPAAARFATDTDVGQWINGARQQYDFCRARIDALRQWADKENQ